MGRLQGKTAVITAAAQGIGRATVEAFSREGATVWATDINEAKLADLAGLPGVTVRRLDVLDTAAVNAFAAEAGPVDTLFNCAGFVHAGSILDCTDAEFDFAIDLNVRSMHRTIRAFLPGMIERGRGSIVNMSSVASSVKSVPNRYAYSLTKAAVIGLTKAVARDVIGQGVRCNALCPGTTLSPSLEDRMQASGDAEEARRRFVARQPMGRLGTVEEMAAAAVYLCSPASGWVTGQCLYIDGGL